MFSYLGHFDDFGKEYAIVPQGNNRNEIEESFFRGVHYYSVVDSRAYLELEALELSAFSSDGVVLAFNPNGIIHRYEHDQEHDQEKKELEPIYFQAKNARALVKKKEIFLDTEVKIHTSNTNLKAEKVSLLEGGDSFYAYHNVKMLSIAPKTNDQITINAKTAVYHTKDQVGEYHDDVNGTIKRKKAYEESIDFKTDLLTVDILHGVLRMQGNVHIKKDNLDADAHRGEVFLENYNKKLKYYALYDDVRLQEMLINLKDKAHPLMRKAFSEKLEGFMSEKKIILTGLPKVFQEKDVIKGNKITIIENIEMVEVDDANTNITLDKKTKD